MQDSRASLDPEPSSGPPETRSFAGIPLRNPEVSQPTVERVTARLSPALALALRSLLAEAPDTDGALLLFERLIESPDIVELLERHEILAHHAIAVFGHSRFLGETLLQNTDLLEFFLHENTLDRSFSREEFHERVARFRDSRLEVDVSLVLARFKRRESVRIMLRDVLKIAPLAETTAEISALADVLIEAALQEAENQLQRRHGLPRHLDLLNRTMDTPFAILALGKLGGYELNYSSDVDLMFIYGDGQDLPAASISNREIFIHLAQRTTDILSRVTPEGPVFRIDLRLRPRGGGGELAIPLSQALTYYSDSADDWERQALIKLRHCAGDAMLARDFIRAVQPRVYTEKVNFAAIKTALVAREKMQNRRRTAVPGASAENAAIDVKIDAGGIRDIEFLVQCLQRVYGGAEPWLRAGGTLFSLQKLHDKGHISGGEFHELNSAYEFLRHQEHRLQLRDGRQTHRLPGSAAESEIIRRAMESCDPGEPGMGDLAGAVRRRMRAVSEIYQRIIFHQQSRGAQLSENAEFKLLSTSEAAAPEQSSLYMLERLATEAPALYEIANRPELSPQTRRNVHRFLTASFATSQRYAALLRHQDMASRALSLFEASEYLSQILIRYPEEIATLAEAEEAESRWGHAYSFERPAVERSLFEKSLWETSSLGTSTQPGDPVFAYLANSPIPYGEKLAILRRHFRHYAFAVGVRDLIESRGVYESFRDITLAAADAMATAFSMAGAPPGLAIMALGRLGSGEFDLLSDADIVFVCDEQCDRLALTRCAEQMMYAVSAYTREGMLFPVDTRLRPRGAEGELLVTPAQLRLYFEREAQPWEALMYTKLRYLAGSKTLGGRAVFQLKDLFERYAADAGFATAVREMRARLEVAETGKSFKTSAGGIYDIDFITSFLTVQHRLAHRQGTQRDRLWQCVSAGRLDKSHAATLDHAAELLRTAEHISRLVVGRPGKWLPATEHGRRTTEKLTGKILNREFPGGLENELVRTMAAVRTIYETVLGAAV